MSDAYRKAGVDTDAGNDAAERMKKHTKKFPSGGINRIRRVWGTF